MRRFARAVVALAWLLLFALPAAGQEAKAGENAAEVKRAVAALDADGVQRLEITGGEYYYDPNYLVLKVNVPAELKVKKTGGITPHNLIVKAPEAGMDFTIDLKKDGTPVKFTPTRVGKYPMYCDKKLLWTKSHRERGMEGTIEVVE